jgi:hypothetical protein
MDIFESLNYISQRMFPKKSPKFYRAPLETVGGKKVKLVGDLIELERAEQILKGSPLGDTVKLHYRDAKVFLFTQNDKQSNQEIELKETSHRFYIKEIAKHVRAQKVKNTLKQALIKEEVRTSLVFNMSLSPLMGELWEDPKHWLYCLATGEIKIKRADLLMEGLVIFPQKDIERLVGEKIPAGLIEKQKVVGPNIDFLGKVLIKAVEKNLYLQAIAFCLEEFDEEIIQGNKKKLVAKASSLLKKKMPANFVDRHIDAISYVLRDRH